MKLDLTHDSPYFNQKLPWEFEHDGFGLWGITEAKLVMVSPQKYFEDVVNLAKTHNELDVYPTDTSIAEGMKERINNMLLTRKEEEKFDIPYILIDSSEENKSGQDGRHRMACMDLMKVESVPCLYLYKTEVKKPNMHDEHNDLLDSPDEYYTTDIISDNIAKDRNGFLILTNIVAARTGVQKYSGRDMGITKPDLINDTFYLERPPEEVFSPETIASFNSAVFVEGHPRPDGSGRGVNTRNAKRLIKGSLRNARKAEWKDENGNELLLVDAVITDETTIQNILNGKRQVSAGYGWGYDIVDWDNRRLKVKDIRANHLALVNRGRAGSAMILDEDIDLIIPLDIKETVTKILIDEGGETMANEKVHKFSTGEEGAENYREYHVKGDYTKEEAQELVIEMMAQENSNK